MQALTDSHSHTDICTIPNDLAATLPLAFIVESWEMVGGF